MGFHIYLEPVNHGPMEISVAFRGTLIDQAGPTCVGGTSCELSDASVCGGSTEL